MRRGFLTIGVATFITFVRILLTPVIVYCEIVSLHVYSLILFIVVILTDIFDGIVARSLHTDSRQGAALDLVADFISIITLYVLFCFYNPVFIADVIFIAISFGLYGYVTLLLKRNVFGKIGKFAGSMCYTSALCVLAVRIAASSVLKITSIVVTFILCLYLAASAIETTMIAHKSVR